MLYISIKADFTNSIKWRVGNPLDLFDPPWNTLYFAADGYELFAIVAALRRSAKSGPQPSDYTSRSELADGLNRPESKLQRLDLRLDAIEARLRVVENDGKL